MAKRRDNPERKLHKSIIEFFRIALPDNAFYFPVPNAGNTSPVRGAMLRASGEIRAGVPDLMIVYGGRLIAVELKSRTGGLQPVQKVVRDQLLLAGASFHLVRTLEAMQEVLLSHNIPLKSRVS